MCFTGKKITYNCWNVYCSVFLQLTVSGEAGLGGAAVQKHVGPDQKLEQDKLQHHQMEDEVALDRLRRLIIAFRKHVVMSLFGQYSQPYDEFLTEKVAYMCLVFFSFG